MYVHAISALLPANVAQIGVMTFKSLSRIAVGCASTRSIAAKVQQAGPMP